MRRRVSPAIAKQWRREINRRQYRECKKHIIADISQRTGHAHSTIYYWVANPEFRSKIRKYGRKYRAEHPEKYRESSLKYEIEHKQERTEYRKTKRSDPRIKEHNRLQTRFYRKICKHMDEFLPRILPTRDTSASVEEMVDSLYVVTGHTVRPSTLEKSINNYIAHNPAPIIQRVNGKYVRI